MSSKSISFPFQEYKYFIDYFNLIYHHYPEKVIQRVHDFFGDIPIIFISLETDRLRLKNVKSIIKKYRLKNAIICKAIHHKDIVKEEGTTSAKVVNEKKTYLLDQLASETDRELACFLSHIKAIHKAKELGSPYCIIVEDDVTFDYIHYFSNTIQKMITDIPMEEYFLSLYNNKPDYSKLAHDLSLTRTKNGYYGAVAYVLPKQTIESICQSCSSSQNTIKPPKVLDSLYISDHYFDSLYKIYRVSQSIILPQNVYLQSTLHGEKTNHHIQIQHEYLFHLYNRSTIQIKVPNILYIFKENKFKYFYKKLCNFDKMIFVSSFEDGIEKLYKTGGKFVFSNHTKVILPEQSDTLFHCSACFIESVSKHPFLKYILNDRYINLELNPKLLFQPIKSDYIFEKVAINEKFTFIIPSYNNAKWVEKNLSSVLKQTYKNYDIIYVDDHSNDNTLELVKKFARKNFSNNMTIISNKKRMYQAYSRYIAYKNVYPQNILVLLDGDDWLYDENVLQSLCDVYAKGYESTYGKAVYFENDKTRHDSLIKQEEYPVNVRYDRKFREHKWFNTHLRTCRAKFLQNIPQKFLKNKDKSWLQHSTDMAEWFYILESTRGNTKFMDSITYVYNKDNSTVHFNSWYHNKNSQERTDTINFIKSMKK
jgi:GR25 family glycosyltransferase involved in LPS biosynthesis